MANLSTNSTYTYGLQGNLRRYTIDVSSVSATTSDTVDSRLRVITNISARYRTTAFNSSLGLLVQDNGTNASNNRNIIIARSSDGIAEGIEIVVEGR